MEYDSIVRKIKIDIITERPNPIVEWFNNISSKLIEKKCSVYYKNGEEYVYYINDTNTNPIIFFRDDNGVIWCNINFFWLKLSFECNIKEFDNIENVTKTLLEEYFNTNIDSVKPLPNNMEEKIKAALDNKIKQYHTNPNQ